MNGTKVKILFVSVKHKKVRMSSAWIQKKTKKDKKIDLKELQHGKSKNEVAWTVEKNHETTAKIRNVNREPQCIFRRHPDKFKRVNFKTFQIGNEISKQTRRFVIQLSDTTTTSKVRDGSTPHHE